MPRDPLLGRSIADRYDVIERIGEGAFGSVYAVRHRDLAKRFAMKVMHLRLIGQGRLAERFLREIQVTAAVDHPNVVDIIDTGELADGRPYYTMELLRGEPLAAVRAREHRLPWSRVQPIVLQICDALQAAHDRGVIHRDLKPANCFCLDRRGHDFIKILDFGLAKLTRDAGPELTAQNELLGTLWYMAPEQLVGEPVDVRVDVYATGVILFELLTGAPPFAAFNRTELMHQMLTSEAPSLRSVAPELMFPAGLEEVAAAALRRVPDERYASMNQLATALRAIPPDPRQEPTLPARPAATPRPEPAPRAPGERRRPASERTTAARTASRHPDPRNSDRTDRNSDPRNSDPRNSDRNDRNADPRNTDPRSTDRTTRNADPRNSDPRSTDRTTRNADPRSTDRTTHNADPRSTDRTTHNADPRSTDRTTHNADPRSTDRTTRNADPRSTDRTTRNADPRSTDRTTRNADPRSTTRTTRNAAPSNPDRTGAARLADPGNTPSARLAGPHDASARAPGARLAELSPATTSRPGDPPVNVPPGEAPASGRPITVRTDILAPTDRDAPTTGPRPVTIRPIARPAAARVGFIGPAPMHFARIPAGSFMMGNEDQVSERPAHVVRLAGFQLAVHPVTVAQWRAVMPTLPAGNDGGDELPVVNVSWFDAIEFLNRLSLRERLPPAYQGATPSYRWVPSGGYRLPTEAEWEYAARAGQTQDDLAQLRERAWHNRSAGGRVQRVGQRPPNDYGVHDLHGNIWEWVFDTYAPYKPDAQDNPLGPSSGPTRVVRGGSAFNAPGDLRSSLRSEVQPHVRNGLTGFRVARNAAFRRRSPTRG